MSPRTWRWKHNRGGFCRAVIDLGQIKRIYGTDTVQVSVCSRQPLEKLRTETGETEILLRYGGDKDQLLVRSFLVGNLVNVDRALDSAESIVTRPIKSRIRRRAAHPIPGNPTVHPNTKGKASRCPQSNERNLRTLS